MEEEGFKCKDSGSGTHALNYSTPQPLKAIPLLSLEINHCCIHLSLLFLVLLPPRHTGADMYTQHHWTPLPIGLINGRLWQEIRVWGEREFGGLYSHAPFLQGHHRLVNSLGQMPHSPCQVAVSTTFSLKVRVTSLSPRPLIPRGGNILLLVQVPGLKPNLADSLNPAYIFVNSPFILCRFSGLSVPLSLPGPWLIRLPRTIHQNFLRLSLHRWQRACHHREKDYLVPSENGHWSISTSSETKWKHI